MPTPRAARPPSSRRRWSAPFRSAATAERRRRRDSFDRAARRPSGRCSSPPTAPSRPATSARPRPTRGRPPRPIPKNADAHRILGDAALAAGQDADAEREFTAADRPRLGQREVGARPRRRRRAPEEVEHRGQPLPPRPRAQPEERRRGARPRPLDERARRQERRPHRLRPRHRDRSGLGRRPQRLRRVPLPLRRDSTAPSRS